MDLRRTSINTNWMHITVGSSNTEVIPLELEQTVTLLSKGVAGVPGEDIDVSKFRLNETLSDTILSYNVSLGSTFVTTLTQNVAVVTTTNWRSNFDQRTTIYMVQDSTGGRVVESWDGILWNNGVVPSLNSSPSGHTRIILDSFDGGSTIYGNWTAL